MRTDAGYGKRRRRAAGGVIIASLLGACHPNESTSPGSASSGVAAASSTAAPETGPLRVLTYNVNFGMEGSPSILEAIRDADADLVLLQETTDGWERSLVASLGDRYPHHAFQPHGPSIASGLGVLSKRPLESREVMPSPVGWFASWRILADTPLGKLQLLDVHLRPPLTDPNAFLDGYFSTRDDRRTEIETYARALDPSLPTIVAGDFNEGEDGRAVSFLADRGMKSALPEFSPHQRTWHWFTKLGEISSRLDHVVYDIARLRAVDAKVMERGDSDHFPVLVTLERAGAADGSG